MDVGSGARVDVERHTQFLERVLDNGVVAVDYILWGDPFGFCLYGDGHAMFVATAYHYHVFASQAQEAGVNVGRDVNSGKVAYVYRAVGIGERRGDKCALEILLPI